MQIDMNQAPERETGGPNKSYEPSLEDLKLIKWAKDQFQQHREARRKYDYRWLDFYRLFRGKHWPVERPSWKNAEVFNMIWRLIQQNVPQQTDGNPTVRFLAQNPNDMPFASILNETFEADWDRNNWMYVVGEMLYDSNIYGTGTTHTGFDPDLWDGLGGIEFLTDDPFYIFPDPESNHPNDKESVCFIRARPRKTSRMKRKYPEYAEFIKPDCKNLLADERTDLGRRQTFAETEDMTDVFGINNQDKRRSEVDYSLELELWVKDPGEVVTEENPNAKGEDDKYLKRKKWPKGRKICIVSDVLVYSDHFENDDGKIPFQKHVNYILPREYYGVSEIEPIESPQLIYNKIISFILDVLVLMGNPIWVVDADSGIDTDSLFNRPGDVVEKERGSEARREAGVQLQPWVMNLLEKVEAVFNDIGGNNDVSRGINPTGVTAASAIAQLQATAQTRMRQKSRNLDSFMQEFGASWLSWAMQKYTAPRIFRLTDNQGANKFFRLSFTSDQDGKKAHVVDFKQDAEGNMQEGEIRVFQLQGLFDVKVDTGSSLPWAKAEEEAKFERLLEKGVIDQEEYFKKTNYQGWQEVLGRMKEEQAAAAAAQQQQGA